MSFKVIFFANLREELGMESLEVSAAGITDVPALIEHLSASHGDEWRSTLNADNILVAVNQELTQDSLAINDGDEIAFFPPVTGG
ncbi:MAG: molybdopterin synthase sulfur carrier subunit [Candidatus Azotimanducaceae bacterium]|jgi:molybdopterin synthase sulfur carrier subunit